MSRTGQGLPSRTRRMTRNQHVGDLPAERERGQATRADPLVAAERLGVPVVDLDGDRIGELTDASVPLEENAPHVVVGLDEHVRKRFHLTTTAVDIETRYLKKDDDGSIRLREPLAEVLRHQGFDV